MLKTKVIEARQGSGSVRTYIPESIAEELGIKKGDTLGWEISIKKDGKSAIVVRLDK